MIDPDEVLTTLKLLIIGESGVGKTSLFLRFVEDKFYPEQPPTIGIDFKTRYLNIDGSTVKLSIWDTAGQERFGTIMPSFYRDTHGVILVYDVTNKTTYRKIENWLNEFDLYSNRSNVVKMIIGNKVDLEAREVTKEDGLKLAKKHSACFIESSAKTSEGVQSAFEELVEMILQTPTLWKPNSNDRLNLENLDEDVGSNYSCTNWRCTGV